MRKSNIVRMIVPTLIFAALPACATHSEGGDRVDADRTPADTRGPYTATTAPVWVSRPDGCMQCADECAPVEDVVTELETKGIAVLDAVHRSIPGRTACLACDVCPSGQEYGVLVAPEEAEQLRALGWQEQMGTDGAALTITVDAPHICDLGFLGGAVCDQYCKSQRQAKCGYCTWNSDERRNQCQCYTEDSECHK